MILDFDQSNKIMTNYLLVNHSDMFETVCCAMILHFGGNYY